MIRKVMRAQPWVLALLFAAACHRTPADNRYEVLSKVRGMPSGLPGLSVERAVEQVLADMQGRVNVKSGRWYCNRAIETEEQVYKVGYEFSQNGHTARFGWTYDADAGRIEAITDYARQVTPKSGD